MTYQEQEMYNSPIDFSRIWEDPYVWGNELNCLTDRFDPEVKYKVLCASLDFETGQGELKIQNSHNLHEKIIVAPIKSTINIHYYQFN